MTDVIIIGAGCAGLTAAIYAQRAGLSTILLEENFYGGQIAISNEIENYPAIPSITGPELAQQIYAQAESLGAQIHFETVTQAELSANPKVVTTHTERYEAKAVIIANGVKRRKLGCPGEEAFTGRGVSYCATCDAFFYRGKDVAVLGSGEYALHEAQALLPVAKSVTLLANGQPLTAEFPAEVAVRPEKVEAILGEQRVSGVQLAGGETVALDGVFVALGVAGSTALARKLGAEVDGNRIVTDEHMMTTLPGLYAAGDCTGGLLQVAKAVYEGALAGSEAAKALRKG